MAAARLQPSLLTALLLLRAPAAAQWVCPRTNAIPVQFRGFFTAGSATITLGADAVYVAQTGDLVPVARCCTDGFVNPNKATQMFVTYGNAENYENDTVAGCSLIDISFPTAVAWGDDLSGASCPLGPSNTSPYGGWSSPSPPVASCPHWPEAQVPPSLRGIGRLPDPDGTADSRLYVNASAWTNVTAGSYAAPGCVAAVADAGDGISALTLSARRDGRAQACVWARPGADGASLEYKPGLGDACPSSFSGAQAIPFVFGGGGWR